MTSSLQLLAAVVLVFLGLAYLPSFLPSPFEHTYVGKLWREHRHWFIYLAGWLALVIVVLVVGLNHGF